MRCVCWPPACWILAPDSAQRRGPGARTRQVFTLKKIHAMATPTSTPKHTDPATKNKEKKNEEEVKDKPSGKTVKTQKK